MAPATESALTPGVQSTCFEYTPADDTWTELADDSDLTAIRHSFLMARGPDLDDPADDGVYPIAVGLTSATEIYDPVGQEWREYRDIVEDNWVSYGCLLQYGDKVYHMKDYVYEVDLVTWTTRTLGIVPTFLRQNLGRCAWAWNAGRPGEIEFAIGSQ